MGVNVYKDRFPRRLLMAVAGIVLTALAVTLQKTIAWGVDPFSVFTYGIAEGLGSSYGVVFTVVCVALLLAAFILDRRLLGVSTMIVLFLNGCMVDFFYSVTSKIWPAPGTMTKILLLVFTLSLICVSSALYYTADLGVSPYDAQALAIGDHTRVPFKYARIGTDIFCILAGCLCLVVSKKDIGRYVNFATLIFAFCMGPFIAWCRKHISEPLLTK